MFLQLNHQKLQIYQTSKSFTLACYRLSKQIPPDERFGMISQIRRAALSVHLNIGEGCSRKSLAERKRYYEISRGSLIEIDAAFDIASELNYFQGADITNLGELMIACFKMLTAMIATKE